MVFGFVFIVVEGVECGEFVSGVCGEFGLWLGWLWLVVVRSALWRACVCVWCVFADAAVAQPRPTSRS